MRGGNETTELRILVLAPVGRDGSLTEHALRAAGLHAQTCPNVDDLCSLLLQGCGAVVIAQEALTNEAIDCLSEALNQQQPWSDVPFLVLTTGGLSRKLMQPHLDLMEKLGHITLLERPIRMVTLVTAARAALRSRERQYELRDRLEALHESDQRFRGAFHNAAVGMAVLSTTGHFLEVNSALCDITGYTQPELIRLDLERITHPEDRERGRRLRAQLLAGEIANISHEKRYLRKSGECVWIRLSASLIRDDKGLPARMIALIEEITYRRQAEEALAKQAAELARSNADLQQFAWVTSHDLREPIRTQVAFSQLLMNRYGGQLDQEAQQALQFIESSARRMESLVRDLLSYSRVVNSDQRVFTRVSLRNAVDWAVSNLQATIADTGTFVHRESLPDVIGDEVQVVQLLQNLISNAIQYRSAKPPQIRITAEVKGEQVTVSVKDNGIGIDPRYHDRVFGLFKRLHGDDIQGTGLGLAICRTIVERHGGRIWVESKLGQGADFRFTLPVAS